MCPPGRTRTILDAQGRPYFLWDRDLTDEQFRAHLADSDPQVRLVALGVIMRQARPEDVFLYVSEAEVRASWDQVQPFLGRSRAFWTWLLDTWASLDAA